MDFCQAEYVLERIAYTGHSEDCEGSCTQSVVMAFHGVRSDLLTPSNSQRSLTCHGIVVEGAHLVASCTFAIVVIAGDGRVLSPIHALRNVLPKCPSKRLLECF